jgi:hypothetical protein
VCVLVERCLQRCPEGGSDLRFGLGVVRDVTLKDVASDLGLNNPIGPFLGVSRPVIERRPKVAESTPNERPFPQISSDAFAGPLGEIANLIAPHTEASRAGLLAQLLAAFGNIIGRKAYHFIDGRYHYTNLFVCLSGSPPEDAPERANSLGRGPANL